MDEYSVLVEGDWTPNQNRTVRNKLLKHFLSEKKSGGGECRVETEDGAARAAVVFNSARVRDRVLAKPNHEITIDQTTVQLRLRLDSPNKASRGNTAAPQDSEVTPQRHDAPVTHTDAVSGGGSDARLSPVPNPDPDPEPEPEVLAGCSVALGPVSEDLSRELLCVLVETLSGLDEEQFELEQIWESSVAVVTFRNHTDAERFMSASEGSSKLRKLRLNASLLTPATSVRVERLPPRMIPEMLELYFEKSWTKPDDIMMIPEEQAAFLSFNNPRVVKDICSCSDLTIKSTRVKVYPFYESLGAALMGADRPEFKMPSAFTEPLLESIWRFLRSKDLADSINQKMSPHFCHVELDKPLVKLSPLPSVLRQKDLSKDRVEGWKDAALRAFRELMSEYGAFDCDVNNEAWRLAEREVCAIVRDDVELVRDQSKGVLTVAGRMKDIKRVRAEVEDAVHKSVRQIDRERNGFEEKMPLAPAMFHILNQSGLQGAAQDISRDVSMRFDKGLLTISGLKGEVYGIKSWILERNMALEKKPIDIPRPLQEFLHNVDVSELSEDLFTSQGICAFISNEPKGLFLTGSSERSVNDAEKKLLSSLLIKMVNCPDPEVVKLKTWSELVKNLCESFNTSSKKTLQIQVELPKITISGFSIPVTEANQNLSKFINDFSRVQERVKVESCAVVEFIEKRKREEWYSIARNNQVKAEFDAERPKFTVSGSRVHVQKAKELFLQLTQSLVTDTLKVQKPGAKKFFKSHGSHFLSTILTDMGCVVILRPELPDDDDDDEELVEVQGGQGADSVWVRTVRGVKVSVRRADMCSLQVDAVVNASNEQLQHIGGLALALSKKAGPEMQRDCDAFIRRNGNLSTGKTFVTRSYRLPCRHVIHAVGPRYTEKDAKLADFLLKLVVKDSLSQAEKLQCSSVALPAVSSGVFGFPVELCAEAIAQAVREFCDDPVVKPTVVQEVLLVDNNGQTVKALAEAVKREFSDLNPTVESVDRTFQTEGAVGGTEAGWETVLYEEITDFRREAPPPEKAAPSKTPAVGRFKPGSRGQKLEQITPEGLSVSLVKGNIQDQTTDVIVNTIAENMNLQQGAVSNALLGVAGRGLQTAVLSTVAEDQLPFGEVVITDGFNLHCKKVFHSVCPPWDSGPGPAQSMLGGIVRSCLEEAERLRMSSMSIPALGTGNLKFPRDVVSALMLREVHAFSRKRQPQHLRTVSIVVHPSDVHTVESFTKEFKGQNSQRTVQSEPESDQSPRASSQAQQPPASFSQVHTLSLGVHQMQMGPVNLEVSSGDITKENCDVIVNSSNPDFTLKRGVSKAILDAAGRGVELECANIVKSQGLQSKPMIMTSAGQLPAKNIIHVTLSGPPGVRDLVYDVLKMCEKKNLGSVAFPALGTGAAGADPALVAEAMVGAVEDFVKKNSPKCVHSVKILIFQAAMIDEFHKSMKSREGQPLKTGFMDKVKGLISPLTSLFSMSGDSQIKQGPVLEGHEIEPTIFQLCAETQRAVVQAKRKVEELIVTEQAQRKIPDPLLMNLSPADVDSLNELQKSLTVQIKLDRKSEEEACVHLEGLTRDVSTAESVVRDMIRKLERAETRKKDAFYLSGKVEWQFVQDDGNKKAFDMMTNLALEEALVKIKTVKISINNLPFTADPLKMRANCDIGKKTVELFRKEGKDIADDALVPSDWSGMKSDELLKLVKLTPQSNEYQKVVADMSQKGLHLNKILSIERVQNVTLWKNYQIKKKEIDTKNGHQNNEQVLYHGTGANSIALINKTGFNRSYAGINGAMYGNGSYFAVDPNYSVSRGYSAPDAHGHKRLYVALVLVGEYTTGRPGLATPPVKVSPSDLYDSVTDSTSNPSMFVIFNDVQAYPQYLITFK